MSQNVWIDSLNRFVALVDKRQEHPPEICIQLQVLPSQVLPSFGNEYGDDLFLDIQEVLVLKHHKHGEVTLHVQNFWPTRESGGNNGRPIHRGTAFVSGGSDAYPIMYGSIDVDDTDGGNKRLKTNPVKTPALVGSWYARGPTQILSEGITLIRLHRHDEWQFFNPILDDTASRWLCIEYAETHPLHCHSHPKCKHRYFKTPAFTNPDCFQKHGIYLERNVRGGHDSNAIAVMCSEPVPGVVGFVRPDLALCIAPALDANVLTITGNGFYSTGVR